MICLSSIQISRCQLDRAVIGITTKLHNETESFPMFLCNTRCYVIIAYYYISTNNAVGIVALLIENRIMQGYLNKQIKMFPLSLSLYVLCFNENT